MTRLSSIFCEIGQVYLLHSFKIVLNARICEGAIICDVVFRFYNKRFNLKNVNFRKQPNKVCVWHISCFATFCLDLDPMLGVKMLAGHWNVNNPFSQW